MASDKAVRQLAKRVNQSTSKLCQCNESPILIVDDNDFNLKTLELILKNMSGIPVDKAINGIEAVDTFTSKFTRNSQG
jgi:PleD family two-component response regulator